MERYAAAKQWELAISEYQQTLLLFPGNQHATTELERAYREVQKLRRGRLLRAKCSSGGDKYSCCTIAHHGGCCWKRNSF